MVGGGISNTLKYASCLVGRNEKRWHDLSSKPFPEKNIENVWALGHLSTLTSKMLNVFTLFLSNVNVLIKVSSPFWKGNTYNPNTTMAVQVSMELKTGEKREKIAPFPLYLSNLPP